MWNGVIFAVIPHASLNTCSHTARQCHTSKQNGSEVMCNQEFVRRKNSKSADIQHRSHLNKTCYNVKSKNLPLPKGQCIPQEEYSTN